MTDVLFKNNLTLRHKKLKNGKQSHFALLHFFNVIEEFKVRRSMIKVKITIARTQDLVGNYSSVSAKNAQAAYEHMEEKADSLLDQSNAMTELNDEPTDEAASLEARYGAADGVAVDEELEKLKHEMGL